MEAGAPISLAPYRAPQAPAGPARRVSTVSRRLTAQQVYRRCPTLSLYQNALHSASIPAGGMPLPSPGSEPSPFLSLQLKLPYPEHLPPLSLEPREGVYTSGAFESSFFLEARHVYREHSQNAMRNMMHFQESSMNTCCPLGSQYTVEPPQSDQDD